MIMINTQHKINKFNSHHCSSVHNTRIRYLSTIESSVVQLSADIDFVHRDLKDNFEFSLSRYRLALIQQKILNDLYVLNPLRSC